MNNEPTHKMFRMADQLLETGNVTETTYTVEEYRQAQSLASLLKEITGGQ